VPSPKRTKIFQIVTLDIQRRHLRTCKKFGTVDDCRSASKKKCPFRLYGIGLDEQGNRHKIRRSLQTNDLQIAAGLLAKYRLDVAALDAPTAKPLLSVEAAMRQYFVEEEGRGVSGSTLNSFHKFLDRRRDEERFSPTLIMYADANGIRPAVNRDAKNSIVGWHNVWLATNGSAEMEVWKLNTGWLAPTKFIAKMPPVMPVIWTCGQTALADGSSPATNGGRSNADGDIFVK